MSLELRQLAAECERRAAEFGEKAQDISSGFNPLHFLELEQHWLHLACIYSGLMRLLVLWKRIRTPMYLSPGTTRVLPFTNSA